MAEREERYLRHGLEKGICPSCGGSSIKGTRVGTGQFKDGVFCSLGCQAEYYKLEYAQKFALMKEKWNSDG